MKKVAILYNYLKPLAVSFYEKSKEIFHSKGIEIVNDTSNSDFVVIIGGDGTLLRAFKEIENKDTPIIAINAGNLGFLTEVSMEDAPLLYHEFLNGQTNYEERNLFDVSFKNENYLILNDVVLMRDTIFSNTVNIDVFVDDIKINKYRGDGVILATSTGSTAYSLSAGGPIVYPSLKLYVLTPLANHNLNSRPIILDGRSTISMRISDEAEIGKLMLDGVRKDEISYRDVINIKYSEKTLKLVVPKQKDYYSILRKKLKWGDNLC